MNDEQLNEELIGAAIEVHRELGPGLLESSYERCLMHELLLRGIKVERQKYLPIMYKGIEIDEGYRIDLLVENKVVVELKVVDAILDLHLAQTRTYLKLSNKKLGFLMNFNTRLLKDGIRRVVCNY